MRKWIVVLALLLMMALPVVTVLAAPDDAVVVTANPQDTSITLTWITGNATSTIIRYKTTSFPANPSDGTLAYNGTSFQTTITGLTAGTAYFISVWGFDGVSYSPNQDRKSTRLNSSHSQISYAAFCFK